MYWRTAYGKAALFAMLLLFCIPSAHFFGGAPSFAELRIVEGVVAEIQLHEGLKHSSDVELSVSGSGSAEQLRYYANSGDPALPSLVALRGRAVRAWVKTTYENRIYQLESAGLKVVDYETRNRQISGDPQTLVIYFFSALGAFILLSLKRYSEET